MAVQVFFFSFIFFLLAGVPIYLTLLIPSLLYMVITGNFSALQITHRMFNGVDSFVLTALPFFIFAGGLMSAGGITHKIIDFSLALIGRMRGGLGHVNIMASMVFGGISGSATADTAAIGSILIPAMNKRGYPNHFSGGITVASSTIGIIIPPSIPMVIYAVVAGVSIGRLFLAGAIPGILVGLSMMVVCYILSVKKGYPAEKKASIGEVLKNFKDSIFAIFMPLLIVGGIVGGVVTATEAAVLAVVYALIVGFLVYRQLRISALPRVLKETLLITGIVMIIVAAADIFAWILAYEQIPQKVADLLLSISSNPLVILLIINAFLLAVGTFLDLAPAIIILVPVLLPVVQQLGIDPVHFGAIMVMNLGIGLDTPPVGTSLYAVCHIADISLEELSKGTLPFLISNLAVLFLVTYVPVVAMYLPKLLMG